MQLHLPLVSDIRTTRRVGSRPWIAACFAVIGGLVLATAAVDWRERVAAAEARTRFDTLVERLQFDITKRFNQPVYGLKGARGVYAAMRGRVDRSAFLAYVESRDLPREFPGVRGFAFAERVRREQLGDFVARERADGAPYFEVRTSREAADLFVVKYIEPMSHNVEAWGFDLGSEAVRREAIERAVDTGEPTLSGRLTLLQDQQRGPGFLYFVPVFRDGADPTTPAQRRAAMLGLLYAPIVMSEILAGAEKHGELDFRVSLEAVGGGVGALLFDSRHGAIVDGAKAVATPKGRLFLVERRVVIGGRPFSIEMASTLRTGDGSARATLRWLGAGSALLSLLLGATVWLFIAGRVRAVGLAEAMTVDLARERKRLEAVLQEQAAMLDNDLVGIGKLRNRRVVWKNRALERIFGYGLDALHGQPARVLYLNDADFETIGR